jgi:hypothetical protein
VSEWITMSIKQLRLPSELIIQSIINDSSLGANISLGAKLIDLKFDLLSNQVLATILSDPTAPPKKYPPPTDEQGLVSEDEMKCSSLAKLTPCKIAERIQKELSTYSDKLQLTVKSKFIIAKPTGALSSEWEEINNLVTDIGGKWVKGENSSYWEIPIF